MQEAKQTQPALSQGYGTKDAPIPIDVARATIRADFLKFAGLVMGQVQLPPGHGWPVQPGRALEHELTWSGNCEIASSHSSLSIHGRRAMPDTSDASQIQVEVRYFHPELHYRNGRKKAQTSRQYHDGFGAHLWVDQGRPFWGMHRSLIEGHQFCRGFKTPEDLAQTVVERLIAALSLRASVALEAEITTMEQALA